MFGFLVLALLDQLLTSSVIYKVATWKIKLIVSTFIT